MKTPADEALDTELNQRFQAYITGMQPMLKYAKNGMFEAIINHESEQIRPLDNAYTDILNKAVKIRSTRANQLAELAHQRTRLGGMFMIGAFVLALVMTLITFMVLRRIVIRPLQHAAQRIEKIASGDLTMNDEPAGRNEIGRLSRHLQQMQHSLGMTVGTVRQGAEEIYRGTSEISAGNADLSSRTEEQAAAIEQTAASMEQLTATVKQNADNAHHASKLAQEAYSVANDKAALIAKSRDTFIRLLNATPNGVIRNSDVAKGVVETSLNVGVVTMTDNNVEIHCLIRSLIDSGKDYVVSMLDSLGKLAGAKTEAKGAYPGWQPDANSPVMHLVRETYQRLFNKTPNIQIIHAGLECGLFKKPYPEMDMVSIGPTITGPHSPDEQVHIKSVGHYWTLLTELLKEIPAK